MQAGCVANLCTLCRTALLSGFLSWFVSDPRKNIRNKICWPIALIHHLAAGYHRLQSCARARENTHTHAHTHMHIDTDTRKHACNALGAGSEARNHGKRNMEEDAVEGNDKTNRNPSVTNVANINETRK